MGGVAAYRGGKRTAWVRCVLCLLAGGLLCSSLWAAPQDPSQAPSQSQSSNAGADDPASKTYQAAYRNGFEKGLFEGGSDRRNDKAYNLRDNKVYRQAKSGYVEGEHDPDVYYSAFRRGFREGYEKGFRPPAAADEPTPRPRPLEPAVRAKDSGPEEFVLNAGMEIAVKLLDTLSTRRNERGDVFLVEAVNDIHSRGRLVIPQGTPMQGSVAWVKRPGRIKGEAELKLRFEEILYGEGKSVPISASLVSVAKDGKKIKDGEGTVAGGGGNDAKTVGASAGVGVLIGILTGGKRGGVIGAGAGAAVGLGGVLIRRGPDLTLESETILVIRFDRPATVPLPSPQAD
ncbi:MAG TPA: hypothetical protein VLU25_13745 [Acidobacteriota bacterium]|nr:hypothetical protein [Acidobacteriota bacterium]